MEWRSLSIGVWFPFEGSAAGSSHMLGISELDAARCWSKTDPFRRAST